MYLYCTMSRMGEFAALILIFFVALVVAGREVPEVFSLADDPSNDGDVIVQATDVEAQLTQVRRPAQKPSTRAFGDRCSCGISSLVALSSVVAPLKKHGAVFLSLLKLRRI